MRRGGRESDLIRSDRHIFCTIKRPWQSRSSKANLNPAQQFRSEISRSIPALTKQPLKALPEMFQSGYSRAKLWLRCLIAVD